MLIGQVAWCLGTYSPVLQIAMSLMFFAWLFLANLLLPITGHNLREDVRILQSWPCREVECCKSAFPGILFDP